MSYERAKERARIVKAIAHPVRIMILEELEKGEKCVCQLAPLFDLDISTLSRHLAQLKNAGIVSERKEGTKVIHKLETPCILKIFECCGNVLKNNLKRKSGLL
jgi:ArsR family transcriptional regulator